MYFGHLLLLCAFLWCLFHIPFPDPMDGKKRFFFCIAFVALFFLQKYPITSISEVYLNPASVLFFLGTLVMAYFKPSNRMFLATFVSILLGAVLVVVKDLVQAVDYGVLLGLFCALFAQVFFRRPETATFVAAAAPVFAAGIEFALEWYNIGYSVFEFLTQPLFDAQITGGLLAFLLSHLLKWREKVKALPARNRARE